MVLFLFVQFAGAAFDDAFAHEDGEDRPEEAAAVEEEAQILDVFAVELRLDGDLQFVATVDLRPAGEAGADVVGAVFVSLLDEIRLVPQGGSRPSSIAFVVAFQNVTSTISFISYPSPMKSQS